ncbi:hypothetical protein [Halostagnicola sp. A56]|uniref:hypothetical protein n=1 Tax=Halostagnicola sp. A56 TaxID=1495067 RepID=UPI0012E0E8B8|nr:hypothetical protein [Halostagnicola sp. A56]
MDITVEGEQVVVGHEGTDYRFDVIGENELEFAATGDAAAAAPEGVIESLESKGYIVRP